MPGIVLNMFRRRLLTDKQRWQMVVQLDVGERRVDVATGFRVSQSVVSRLFARYHQSSKVTERRGRGRKRATFAANDQYVILQSLRSRTLSAPKLHQEL